MADSKFQSPLRMFQDDDPGITAKTVKGFEATNKRLSDLFRGWDLANMKGNEGAALFESLLKDSTPEANKVSGERMQGFRDMLADSKAYDPFGEYTKAPNFWLGKADSLREGFINDSRAADSRRRIALGLTGPGQDSGYLQRASTSGIQSGMQDVFKQIMANSNVTFPQLYAARQGERAATLGLYDDLANEVDRPALRSLLPSQVYKQNLADMTGALTPLQKIKEQISYLYRPKGTLEKVADFQESNFNSAVDTGMSLASMYFGGGAGGALGGMAGGAGAGGASGGGSASSILRMLGGGGGGAGGSSMNISQIAALLPILQRLYGGGGGANIGSDLSGGWGGSTGASDTAGYDAAAFMGI